MHNDIPYSSGDYNFLLRTKEGKEEVKSEIFVTVCNLSAAG
jgi:hypothetical protein